MWFTAVKYIVSAGLGYLSKRADTDIERGKIDAQREDARNARAVSVVQSGMQHKAFWVPWLLAAVPLSAWFAWGVLDTIFNGALPSVATLPPQLKQYADIVWGNIFYVGGGVAGLQILAGAIRR